MYKVKRNNEISLGQNEISNALLRNMQQCREGFKLFDNS